MSGNNDILKLNYESFADFPALESSPGLWTLKIYMSVIYLSFIYELVINWIHTFLMQVLMMHSISTLLLAERNHIIWFNILKKNISRMLLNEYCPKSSLDICKISNLIRNDKKCSITKVFDKVDSVNLKRWHCNH